MTASDCDRIHIIDALRGVAAISVAVFHFSIGNDALLPRDNAVRIVGSYGYLGVAIFFVISGFVIPYAMALRNYSIRATGFSFMVRRLTRLEPAYFASILLTVLLLYASILIPGSRAKLPEYVGSNLLMHIAYLVPWLDGSWYQPVYWSLAIEFQYYVLMAISAPLLLSKDRRLVYLFLSGALVLAFCSKDARLFPMYLPLFGMGFVAFAWRTKRIPSFQSLIYGGAFLAAGLYIEADNLKPVVGVFTAILLAVHVGRPALVFEKLGLVSYSLYLVHVPVGGKIINLATRTDSITLHILSIAAALIISLVVAHWFHTIFELHVPRAINGYILKRRFNAGKAVLVQSKSHPLIPVSLDRGPDDPA